MNRTERNRQRTAHVSGLMMVYPKKTTTTGRPRCMRFRASLSTQELIAGHHHREERRGEQGGVHGVSLALSLEGASRDSSAPSAATGHREDPCAATPEGALRPRQPTFMSGAT